MYGVIRNLLFRLPPEQAHNVALTSLDALNKLGLLKALSPKIEALPVNVMGLDFPNPVGLAAGLDKNADHVDALGPARVSGHDGAARNPRVLGRGRLRLAGHCSGVSGSPVTLEQQPGKSSASFLVYLSAYAFQLAAPALGLNALLLDLF